MLGGGGEGMTFLVVGSAVLLGEGICWGSTLTCCLKGV